MKFSLKWIAAAGVLLAAALPSSVGAQNKTTLTVYTAVENDALAAFKRTFEADNPDIEISWMRDSTGVVTARFLAEKNNRRADIIWGLTGSSLLLFKSMGLLEPYTPKGAETLKPLFRDSASPMSWTGMDAYLAITCFNTLEAAKRKVKAPVSWQDLTKPEYEGQIVMPHPASSGTGYIVVAAWIQLMGEENAWRFMDALHKNIAVYTHSGSAPCVQAAKGERMIGIGFDRRGAAEKTRGAPLDLIVPTEGVGWDIEATGIVKGTKNLSAAKRLADWAVSKKANELYNTYYAIVAHPDVNSAPPNYPTTAEAKMVKNDLAWMGKERERILAEWSKRYESKAAPKSN